MRILIGALAASLMISTAAFAAEAEGKIQAIDTEKLTITLDDGKSYKLPGEFDVAALKDYRLSTPEFLQVKTKDGFTLEAMLIKPVDFDPSRKYPVFQSTYAGPHAPQVRNSWGGMGMLYHQLLAQREVVLQRAVRPMEEIDALVTHDARSGALLILAQTSQLERIGSRVVRAGVAARAADEARH